MSNRISKRRIGRKRRHRLINTKNCPITKYYRLVHGYEVEGKKTGKKHKTRVRKKKK